jgi:hypothetical protein
MAQSAHLQLSAKAEEGPDCPGVEANANVGFPVISE